MTTGIKESTKFTKMSASESSVKARASRNPKQVHLGALAEAYMQLAAGGLWW